MRVWLWLPSGGVDEFACVVSDKGLLNCLDGCDGEPLSDLRVIPFEVDE